MHGIRVTRLEDGFGTFQELDRQSTDIRGKRFQFYHGTFKEGKKDGYGIWYTDEGIFSGQVKDNQPCGKGRMDYANGDSVTGAFSLSRGHKESLLGENPYARGEPNGKCTRTFADGSFYEGEMKVRAFESQERIPTSFLTISLIAGRKNQRGGLIY